MSWVLIGYSVVIVLIGAAGGIVSWHENERRAAVRLIGLTLLGVCPYLVLAGIGFPGRDLLSVIFILVPIAGTVFLFRKTPLPESVSEIGIRPGLPRFDERQVMFSRSVLREGSHRFTDYYAAHPEHRKCDDIWRELPGLMSPDSLFADERYFASASASFRAVFELHKLTEGQVAETEITRTAAQWTEYLREWGTDLGACDIGFTELRDYHLYSHVGRGDDYGQPVDLNHRYAIALTVEMDRDVMKTAPNAPVVSESARRYFDSGAIAVQLALFIRRMGYPARAHIDASYNVICPLVARDAGLGEIGRMGLLMTPRQGPRVRIAVVTTDMPLETVSVQKVGDPTMIAFCDICKKCAVTCPGQAIPMESRYNYHGSHRWQISSEDCFTYWCRAGTDCGRCMSVCPYSHPDNFLHNLIRWGIRRNHWFRVLAWKMDDLIYGR